MSKNISHKLSHWLNVLVNINYVMELIALECDRFHNIVKRNVVIACVLFPNLGRGNLLLGDRN